MYVCEEGASKYKCKVDCQVLMKLVYSLDDA